LDSYKQLLIYYFSGTGNVLLASKQIAEIAESKGIHTELKPIDRLKKIELPIAEGRMIFIDVQYNYFINFVITTHLIK